MHTNVATELLGDPDRCFPLLFMCLPLPALPPQTHHRSTACLLPDCTSHTDKKSLVLMLSHPQPPLSLQGKLLRKSLPWQPHKFWNFATRGQTLVGTHAQAVCQLPTLPVMHPGAQSRGRIRGQAGGSAARGGRGWEQAARRGRQAL